MSKFDVTFQMDIEDARALQNMLETERDNGCTNAWHRVLQGWIDALEDEIANNDPEAQAEADEDRRQDILAFNRDRGV